MCHRNQKHLFLLLENVHNYLLLGPEVLVLLPAIDKLQCLFNYLLLLSAIHCCRNVFLVNGDAKLIKSFEGVSVVGRSLLPNLLACFID